jgi:hypothetical protein
MNRTKKLASLGLAVGMLAGVTLMRTPTTEAAIPVTLDLDKAVFGPFEVITSYRNITPAATDIGFVAITRATGAVVPTGSYHVSCKENPGNVAAVTTGANQAGAVFMPAAGDTLTVTGLDYGTYNMNFFATLHNTQNFALVGANWFTGRPPANAAAGAAGDAVGVTKANVEAALGAKLAGADVQSVVSVPFAVKSGSVLTISATERNDANQVTVSGTFTDKDGNSQKDVALSIEGLDRDNKVVRNASTKTLDKGTYSKTVRCTKSDDIRHWKVYKTDEPDISAMCEEGQSPANNSGDSTKLLLPSAPTAKLGDGVVNVEMKVPGADAEPTLDGALTYTATNTKDGAVAKQGAALAWSGAKTAYTGSFPRAADAQYKVNIYKGETLLWTVTTEGAVAAAVDGKEVAVAGAGLTAKTGNYVAFFVDDQENPKDRKLNAVIRTGAAGDVVKVVITEKTTSKKIAEGTVMANDNGYAVISQYVDKDSIAKGKVFVVVATGAGGQLASQEREV